MFILYYSLNWQNIIKLTKTYNNENNIQTGGICQNIEAHVSSIDVKEHKKKQTWCKAGAVAKHTSCIQANRFQYRMQNERLLTAV